MDWRTSLALAYYVASLAMPFLMLFVVPRDRKPSSAIAWLLVIAILSWLGLFLFLVLGNPRLPRQRRRRHREMKALLRSAIHEAREDPEAAPWIDADVPERYAGVATMGDRLGALPAFGGNDVQVLSDYEATFRDIAAAIDRAERFVHVQYYILTQDLATEAVITAMERAAKRGVQVRVLMDHLGSRGFYGASYLRRRLLDQGIAVHRMLPFEPWRGRIGRPDLRNHRKIVVVDGDVGYVGSQNLVEPAYRKRAWQRARYEYRDIVARVRGPIVQQLDAIFRMDWYAEAGTRIPDAPLAQTMAGDVVAQVIPSGPGHEGENNLRIFNALLYRARHRIVVVNAYFVPDETLMMALTGAALRGVEVHLITPERGNQILLRHAQRSFYGDLLRAGVHVHLHPRPWNLHSKTIRIDDDAVVIGSSNLDIRSFELNLEVSLLCFGGQVCQDLRAVEDAYIAESRELTLHEWERLSAPRRLLDNIARLTSSLQ